MRKSSIRSEGGIAARRQNTFHMASIIAAMLVAGMALLDVIGAPSRADDVEGFYKGHSLSMIVGFGGGGGYDLYGRLVSRYMGKYLPGKPTALVAAFERTTQDLQFKAHAQRIKLDVDFVPAQAIDKFPATAHATPKALIAKTADAISK
jgi:hypothetical protein